MKMMLCEDCRHVATEEEVQRSGCCPRCESENIDYVKLDADGFPEVHDAPAQ